MPQQLARLARNGGAVGLPGGRVGGARQGVGRGGVAGSPRQTTAVDTGADDAARHQQPAAGSAATYSHPYGRARPPSTANQRAEAAGTPPTPDSGTDPGVGRFLRSGLHAPGDGGRRFSGQREVKPTVVIHASSWRIDRSLVDQGLRWRHRPASPPKGRRHRWAVGPHCHGCAPVRVGRGLPSSRLWSRWSDSSAE